MPPILNDQPDIPRYGDGDGPVSVHTPALRLAGANIGSLDTWFSDARVRLEDVDVRAGAFYEAETLEETVGSKGKDKGLNLKRASVDSVVTWRDTVIAVNQGCSELAGKYDTIEQLNTMTADDLKKGFGTVFAYNPDLAGLQTTTGNTVPPAPPPE